jgi:transcriptional regulator with XRE-family HTH domain
MVLETRETQRITALLEARGMSVVDLARRLKVTRQRVYEWISGRSPIPRNRLEDIAEVFDVSPALLVYGESNIDEGKIARLIALVQLKADAQRIDLAPEKMGMIVAQLYAELDSSQAQVDEGSVEKMVRLSA